MLPARAALARTAWRCPFLWAAGIEDTIIPQPSPATGRVLDEYRLTGHDRRWRSDFSRLAGLGVGAVRYGIPWHELNPAPRRWDWRMADQRIDRLLALGLDPIIDLLHYGAPPWLEGGLLARDFPLRFADLAARFAQRFRGRVRWYTPVNEPRITAWYCGRLGRWPPWRRGWGGFVAVLMALARGARAAADALRAVDADIVDLHVDAADRYRAGRAALQREALWRTRIGFLALDLVAGRVDRRHPLCAWLQRWGADDDGLAWLQRHGRLPAAIGVNCYPIFSLKVLERSRWGLRMRMPYAPVSVLAELLTAYWRRYRCPLMVSETASRGAVSRRLAWLEASTAAVLRLRRRGVLVLGYTWWPMTSLISWAYAHGRKPWRAYLQRMGLWELGDGDDAMARVETALVDAYRRIIQDSRGAAMLPRRPASGRNSHVT